jgi:Short C-terminal domain
MPGLLRGIARTAVIAGTATAVSNRVSRRQGERWAEEDEGGYAAPPADEGPDQLEQLKQLGELKASGVLTDAEFEAQKAKILAG